MSGASLVTNAEVRLTRAIDTYVEAKISEMTRDKSGYDQNGVLYVRDTQDALATLIRMIREFCATEVKRDE